MHTRADYALQADEALMRRKESTPIEVTIGEKLTGGVAATLIKSWDKGGELVGLVEFKSGLAGAGIPVSSAEMERLFMTLDEDGGGELSPDELRAVVKTWQVGDC